MATELAGEMKYGRAPVLAGFVAGMGMLGFYFSVLSVTKSSTHALHLLGELWPWMAALVVGFSIEVGLFVYLIRELKRRRGAVATLATTGGVSACSMVVCCAPRLADVIPLIGLSAAAVFLAEHMKFFLLLGIMSNVVGIIIMLGKIQKHRLYNSAQRVLKTLLRYDMVLTTKIAIGIGAFVLFAVLVPTLLGGSTGSDRYRSTEEVMPNDRQGIMTFDISFEMPRTANELRLWLPYVTSNEYQTVEDVKIDGNFDYSGVYREAEHGNIILYAKWNRDKEYARLTYSFQVKRKEMIMKNFPKKEAPIPADLMEKYLLPTSLGPTIGEVKKSAMEITSSKRTVLGKAMAIYDYIVENGERDPDIKGCGVGNVEALLKNLSGKCVDISSVFVTLARSVGVPAREIFGTRISKEGDISGAYHCRAEFYLPGYGWVPVDPSDVLKLRLRQELELDDPETIEVRQYLFGAQSETYIDFYTGRDITLNPPQEGGKLTYIMYPYAEIDGKPLDFITPGHPAYQEGLKYVVTYEEIVGSTLRVLPW